MSETLEILEAPRSSLFEQRSVSQPTRCSMEYIQQRVTIKRSELYFKLSWEYTGFLCML